MKKIQSVLIYGYGVMGRGVAKTFAQAGFQTMVRSARAASITDLPDGVTAVATLPAKAPDLIIELVPEIVATKQQVFADVEAAYEGQDYLLGTGTSGLDLVELAKTLKHPEKFLGIHYFMPADTAPVVEVMGGGEDVRPIASHRLTDDAVSSHASRLLHARRRLLAVPAQAACGNAKLACHLEDQRHFVRRFSAKAVVDRIDEQRWGCGVGVPPARGEQQQRQAVGPARDGKRDGLRPTQRGEEGCRVAQPVGHCAFCAS